MQQLAAAAAASHDAFRRSLWPDAKAEADEERAAINAAAERGLWALADLYIPNDVREAATRWHMEHTLCEMWRSAFVHGWRAAIKAATDAERKG